MAESRALDRAEGLGVHRAEGRVEDRALGRVEGKDVHRALDMALGRAEDRDVVCRRASDRAEGKDVDTACGIEAGKGVGMAHRRDLDTAPFHRMVSAFHMPCSRPRQGCTLVERHLPRIPPDFL